MTADYRAGSGAHYRPSELAPAGWYRNPDTRQRDHLRYWNGRQWTEVTRPVVRCRIEHRPPGDAWTNFWLTVLTMGLWAPVWMVRSAHRYRVRKL
jgi:hypothetical protein